ncbi:MULTISPECIES: multiprotein-bridging factor 1 family protein [unclassified Haladaptatus]|uniref:helix-turn-helix domain-containing protein n=1 Tax=unclassified Haladaptatus TaxID=2622732 RepID=UPI0023E894E6|nr:MULTISPECIES: multiprotein-bridging factor 1 family protein [unclassified Haladaptatus]
MAKYSTGSNRGGGGGDSCELCGKTTGDLRTETIAGAELLVCRDCAPHGDSKRERKERANEPEERRESRKKRAARNVARMADARKGDPTHWEKEGTHYDEDPLPYLVKGYGDLVTAARQEAGLTVSDLAEDLELDEDDVLAVEQGRATSAGVGGSVIEALEERFDLTLAE